MKAKVQACLSRIEALIYRRAVFAALCWLAVLLALLSMFGGGRWAIASCALSLAVIAHTFMALLNSAGMLANSFDVIRDTYRKECEGTAKKQTQAAQPEPAKVH